MPGLALPDGAALQVDGVPAVATTEIRKVPALGDCDTMSFVSAIVQCSQLGLEPGGALGHAYLLPFGNKNEKSGKKRSVNYWLPGNDRPCPPFRTDCQPFRARCP
ncbi:RecT protein [Salmonella enterica subsp. enterica serovar Ohio str. CFSAN001079]|nr:RecT protein [Salmonella enterica subsp. enterica serovar Ohio str. CFSAN001079]